MLMDSFSPLKRSEREIIKLPRGGYIIKTTAGCIQFGIPPETMKDAMNLKIEIPTYFLLPTSWFDRFCAVNVAEFEFPAYFNFFVKKKKINLICSKEGAEQIKIIFQETLLGPKNFDNFKQDFDPNYPSCKIPQIQKELSYFARNPFNPSEELQIETLIDFTIFDDETQTAMISPTVGVRKDRNKFVILEDDQEIAVFRDFVRINQLMGDEQFNDYQLNIKLGLFYNPSLELEENKVNVLKESYHEIIKEFQPPVFGVTVLGGSHGFDPKGMTTGYVLWINGRGVMIDPPVFSAQYLKRQGIPSILIDSVIITHCHADHDTGILQKMLESGKIELITTRTIMQSYLKKYSAISAIPQQQLQTFFKFRPVTIGNKVTMNGGHLNFFYSFHSIPCLGFTAHFENKSIYFSGDTFYNPKRLEELFQEGIMTKERYEELTTNKWNHDIILHEAGVPPIHTPMQVLQEVDNEIKKKLFLVHCADKDVPSDLQHAKTGLENTLVIEIAGNSRLDTFRKLDILSCIDLFENCSIKQVRDLMDACTEIEIAKGKRVCNEGDIGNEFFIIVNGVVRIFSEKLQFERYLYVGDWFGESALFEGDYRMANVEAVTDSRLILLKRNDFYFVFGEQNNEKTVVDQMLKLLSSRKSKTLSTLVKNRLFNNLSSNQKIQLEMIFKEKQVKKKEIIWQAGQPFNYGVIMNKGEIGFINCFEEKVEIDMGTFLCEMDACLNEKLKLTTTLVALKNSTIYIAKQKNLQKFFHTNPGLLVLLQGYKYLF